MTDRFTTMMSDDKADDAWVLVLVDAGTVEAPMGRRIAKLLKHIDTITPRIIWAGPERLGQSAFTVVSITEGRRFLRRPK
jgi:hypothetical protein